MSSLRSHFRQHPQQQDANSQPSKRSSRIPTKPVAAEGGKPTKAAHHVSKLAKRAGRPITSPEPGVKSGTTRTAVPVTAAVAQGSTGSSRRISVTPSGTTLSPAPPNMRTPSLVSGSSVSTFESPPTTLRRRPSGAIDRYATRKRAGTTSGTEQEKAAMHDRSESRLAAFDETVLGISLPSAVGYGELHGVEFGVDGYERGLLREFTPPDQIGYAPSATPSTRYTDSPFSHAATPSSASSYSPGILATSNTTSRSRPPTSPTRSRPPLSGRTPSKDETTKLGLPLVRESSTSSSNSTVRPEGKFSHVVKGERARASAFPLPNKINEAAPLRSASYPDKGRLVSSPAKQHVLVPPELAHLNIDPPTNLSPGKSLPPVRPTRDGTANISDMNRPSPVVQSDLPSLYTTYHKRTPSQETPASASSPSFKSRFGFSSRSSSRTETTRIDSAVSPPPAARSFHRGPTPELKRKEGSKLQRKDSPAVVTGPSPSKSPRFGFFSRKPRNEPAKVVEKPKRRPSKGPAAGTGHEGYGRFSARGRNPSTSSSGGVRSPSLESNSSGAPIPVSSRTKTKRKSSSASKDGVELDEFLRERLNPVILRGSGSTISATASSSDLAATSLHPASSKSSSLDSLSQPHLLPSALQELTIGSRIRRLPVGFRRPSDSSEDDVSARYPNLATRRSLTRMSSGGSRSPVRVPEPINTKLPSQPSRVDSYDAETSDCPRTDSTIPLRDETFGPRDGNEGEWPRPRIPESPTKTGRRWNFFQRATSTPRPKSRGKERAVERHEVPELVAHQSSYRGVAHYALLGPVEPIDLEEVQRIAQENETSAEDSMSESNTHSRMVPYERRHTSLLPSPPKLEYGSDSEFHARPPPPRILVQRQDSSETPELLHVQPVFAHQTANVVDIPRSPAGLRSGAWNMPEAQTPDMPDAQDQSQALGTPERGGNSSRQPRLSPIGRIPAVISKRDRDRKLPDNSFSRPFARTQPRPSVKPPGSVYSQIRDMASPIESGSQPVSSTSTRSDGNSAGYKSSTWTNPPSTSTNRTSMEIHVAHDEFFAFPPRKNSEQSYSGSSGNPSWMGGLYAPPQQQEDVWNEYNDFLDEVMPLKTPTTGSSLGAPFQYSHTLYDGNGSGFPTHSLPWMPPSSELPLPPGSNSASTVLSVPQQISRFLQPSMSPITPDTLACFASGYGNRSTSTLLTSNRTSVPSQHHVSMQQPARSSLTSARGSTTSSRHSGTSRHSGNLAHSRSTSLPEAVHRQSQSSTTPSTRISKLRDIAEIPSDASGTSASLRFGALMTSKWLSLGRVLFSPAHNELQFADEAKVLVVDGLSSDWSYYVALSYPSAQVYNLTPSMPGSPSFTWPETSAEPPINHHQIPLTNISTPFPFPKGFFTAVLFRFPTATTEQAYTACISECKRVLRPGGYLEVAILDLDLMNMGTKARKAVRGLKTRMQHRDQNVCLRNLSDILVRLIGRRGFESVQRCIVGVPAAGRIPRSQDLSSSGSDSSKPIWHREIQSSKSQEFSFADLLEDAKSNQFGESKNNDETITKMVARVGRWWYSTCYEKALLPTDQSIWSDPTLLRECEKQGTSFRLLICHAQKPTQTRRRTVSL